MARLEGFAEGLFEVVDVPEVVPRVGILLAKHSLLDEVEDNVPEVGAGMNAPLPQEGVGHWSKLLEGVIAKAEEKFLSADVSLDAVVVLTRAFEREVEGVFQEKVRAFVKSLVEFADILNRRVEAQSLHKRGQ